MVRPSPGGGENEVSSRASENMARIVYNFSVKLSNDRVSYVCNLYKNRISTKNTTNSAEFMISKI